MSSDSSPVSGGSMFPFGSGRFIEREEKENKERQEQELKSGLSGVPKELRTDFFADQDFAYGNSNHIGVIQAAVNGQGIKSFNFHLSDDCFELRVFNPTTSQYETRLYKEVTYEITLDNGKTLNIPGKINTNAILPSNPKKTEQIQEAIRNANRMALVFVHLVQSAFDPNIRNEQDFQLRLKLRSLAGDRFLAVAPLVTTDSSQREIVQLKLKRQGEEAVSIEFPLQDLTYRVTRTAGKLLFGSVVPDATDVPQTSLASVQERVQTTAGVIINPKRREVSLYSEDSSRRGLFDALEHLDMGDFLKLHGSISATLQERYGQYILSRLNQIDASLDVLQDELESAEQESKEAASLGGRPNASTILANARTELAALEKIGTQLAEKYPSLKPDISEQIDRVKDLIAKAEVLVGTTAPTSPDSSAFSSQVSSVVRKGDFLTSLIQQTYITLNQQKNRQELGAAPIPGYLEAIKAAEVQFASSEYLAFPQQIDLLLLEIKRKKEDVYSKIETSVTTEISAQWNELNLLAMNLLQAKTDFLNAVIHFNELTDEEAIRFNIGKESADPAEQFRDIFHVPANQNLDQFGERVTTVVQYLRHVDDQPDFELLSKEFDIDKGALASVIPSQPSHYGKNMEAVVEYQQRYLGSKFTDQRVIFAPPVTFQNGRFTKRLDPSYFVPNRKILFPFHVISNINGIQTDRWILAHFSINQNFGLTLVCLDPTKLSYADQEEGPLSQEDRAEKEALERGFARMLRIQGVDQVPFEFAKITNASTVLPHHDKPGELEATDEAHISTADSGVLVCSFTEELAGFDTPVPDMTFIGPSRKPITQMNIVDRIRRQVQSEKKAAATEEQEKIAAAAPQGSSAPARREVTFGTPEYREYRIDEKIIFQSKTQRTNRIFNRGIVNVPGMVRKGYATRDLDYVESINAAALRGRISRATEESIEVEEGAKISALDRLNAALSADPFNSDALKINFELLDADLDELISGILVPAQDADNFEKLKENFTALISYLKTFADDQTDPNRSEKILFVARLMMHVLDKLGDLKVIDPFLRDYSETVDSYFETYNNTMEQVREPASNAINIDWFKSKPQRIYNKKLAQARRFHVIDKTYARITTRHVTKAYEAYLESAQQDLKILQEKHRSLKDTGGDAEAIESLTHQIAELEYEIALLEDEAVVNGVHEWKEADLLFDHVDSLKVEDQIILTKAFKKIYYMAKDKAHLQAAKYHQWPFIGDTFKRYLASLPEDSGDRDFLDNHLNIPEELIQKWNRAPELLHEYLAQAKFTEADREKFSKMWEEVKQMARKRDLSFYARRIDPEQYEAGEIDPEIEVSAPGLQLGQEQTEPDTRPGTPDAGAVHPSEGSE